MPINWQTSHKEVALNQPVTELILWFVSSMAESLLGDLCFTLHFFPPDPGLMQVLITLFVQYEQDKLPKVRDKFKKPIVINTDVSYDAHLYFSGFIESEPFIV